MRLLVTRPEPDATRQAEKLTARGHEPVLAPLLRVEFVPAPLLDLTDVQALIVTSRNALRALAARAELGEAVKLPLVAVGDATAADAGMLGFADPIAGPGTGEGLPALIEQQFRPDAGPLLNLRGEVVAHDLKRALDSLGFEMRESVLYRTTAASALPGEVVSLIEAGRLEGVILMSRRTAETFAALLQRHGLAGKAPGLNCYCLSQAVAEAVAPLGPRLLVPAHPGEEDLLALIEARAAS